MRTPSSIALLPLNKDVSTSIVFPLGLKNFLKFFFQKVFIAPRSISWGHWYPLFPTSDDSAHEFQSQGGSIVTHALLLLACSVTQSHLWLLGLGIKPGSYALKASMIPLCQPDLEFYPKCWKKLIRFTRFRCTAEACLVPIQDPMLGKPLADPRGCQRVPPPPNGIQFFCFHIRFHQKAPMSEVGAPPPPQWLGAPTNRKSWIHHWVSSPPGVRVVKHH